jgi:phage FluMu protein Com
LVPSSTAAPPDVRSALEPLKCCKCGRTIAKVTPGENVLRAGHMLQFKCPRCDGLSYLVGLEAP